MQSQSQALLTKRDVASQARVSARTVDYWMKRGWLPVYQNRVGREVSSSRLPKIYRGASCEMNGAGPPGQKNESAPAKKRSRKPSSISNSLRSPQCQRRRNFQDSRQFSEESRRPRMRETPLARWWHRQRARWEAEAERLLEEYRRTGDQRHLIAYRRRVGGMESRAI